MIKTREDAVDVALEACPVCADTRVRVVELGWFGLELERGDELRHEAGRAETSALEFRCFSCGSRWS